MAIVTKTFDEAKFKLVPLEPTEAMIAAGDAHMDGASHLGMAWDAMLAAAPPPPSD